MESTTEIEPIEFDGLRDRAQIYILGLEAKLRQAREENEHIRSQDFTDAQMRRKLEDAYSQGWKDHGYRLTNTLQASINALGDLRRVGLSQSYNPTTYQG